MRGETIVTYEALAGAIARGAMELDAAFPVGSRLLIAAYDQLVVALGFLAALQSHCTPLLVDPQSTAGLARIAARWKVAGSIGDRSLFDEGAAVVDESKVLGWLTAAAGAVPLALPGVGAEDAAFWTFTSGTTGEPRAVVHAHRGPQAAYEAFGCGVLALGPEDRTVSTAGLPFVYALGNNLLFPLFAGGAAILPADLLLPTVLAEIGRQQATVLVSGPWSIEAMARLADRAGRGDALRRLRLVLSAGEPLGPGVFAAWRDTFGQTPIDNLGCTEMFNSFLSTSPGQARAGSLGRVVPGFDVRVDGAAPEAGRRGALTVRGASRAIGISTDSDSDRVEVPSGEWCETGDEVEVGADGTFTFLGRLDDRFKVRGQFVRPAEVERRLQSVDGIEECLVGPGTDARGLACVRVRIVVASSHDDETRRREVAAVAREVLPAAGRAIRVETTDALPRSPRGKVLRQPRVAVG